MRAPGDYVVRLSTSGDPQRAQAYVPQALALLQRTQERMRVGRLAQLSAQMRFDDGAYSYVVIAGGLQTVHIVAGYGAETSTDLQLKAVAIPDFISGAAHNGFIDTVTPDPPALPFQTLDTFHPTQRCADTFKLGATFQSMRRLAVEPYDSLESDLKNPNEDSPNLYSQYTRLKPTMYSGRMRSVVQTLMGFGRSQLVNGQPKSIYDQTNVPEANAPEAQSAYQIEVASNGLQIRYDWRFSRTHGITTGPDGAQWLVEIGISNGVIAMPLPINPLTQAKDFQDRIAKKGDQDAQAILDAFGGFPTGEVFQTGDELDAWIRAGRVVRLLDHDAIAPFYDYTAYSSAMGWAFNDRGDEAHNTAWRYGQDNIQRGAHYMLPISIGAKRPKPKQTHDLSAVRSAIAKASGKTGQAAALWKLAYLDDFEIVAAQAALQHSAGQAFDYVDQLVLDPLAPASTHLSQVSEGILWFPPSAKRNNGNIIRYPEPSAGYLVSHDMRPGDEHAVLPDNTIMDTTMHVFFVENELHWVKWYWDTRPPQEGQETDNFEDCMYIGSWKQHIDGGQVGVPKMFYTSVIDDRAELPVSTTDVAITSVDLGYNNITAWDFEPSVPHGNEGGVDRTKRFKRRTTTDTVDGIGMVTGVAVPFYDREAYYYAMQRTTAGSSHTDHYEYNYLSDPWHYWHWRNRSLCTGESVGIAPSDGETNITGYWIKLAQHPDGYGPVTFRCVLKPGEDLGGAPFDNYEPYACSDAADSGPWCFGGENATAMSYDIPEPPLPADIKTAVDATGHYDVTYVNADGQTKVRSVDSLGFGLWPVESPDPESGVTQYIEATRNAMGEAVSGRRGIDINDAIQVYGTPNWAGMESGFLTYLGVIDG